MLALVAAVPGSYLFFMFWFIAWRRMNREDGNLGEITDPHAWLHGVILFAGFVVCILGTCAAVETIKAPHQK